MNKEKVLLLVEQICSTESTNCRSLNKVELAKQLLVLANVPQIATICEIPLDWNSQVVILFTLPNDSNYYSLFSGIGTDGNFHFELAITGKFEKSDTFNFYDEDEEIAIDYFLEVSATTENQERTFAFYENGIKEVFTLSQIEQIFINDIDAEQKENGTTFESWLEEMLQMQIYNEVIIF